MGRREAMGKKQVRKEIGTPKPAYFGIRSRERVRLDVRLYDEDDWRDWAKDRRRGCVFIPRDPWNAYRNRGWIDMDDWLGRPLPFAKRSARESSRKSGGYGRKRSVAAVDSRTTPSRVPVRPGMYYRDDGWIDYDDWLASV